MWVVVQEVLALYMHLYSTDMGYRYACLLPPFLVAGLSCEEGRASRATAVAALVLVCTLYLILRESCCDEGPCVE